MKEEKEASVHTSSVFEGCQDGSVGKGATTNSDDPNLICRTMGWRESTPTCCHLATTVCCVCIATYTCALTYTHTYIHTCNKKDVNIRIILEMMKEKPQINQKMCVYHDP